MKNLKSYVLGTKRISSIDDYVLDTKRISSIDDYVLDTKRISSIDDYVQEAFRINQDNKPDQFIKVKDEGELRQIIWKRYVHERSNWDNPDNAVNELIDMDCNDIDVSNCKDMSYLFSDFRTLRSIDISQWDMSNVENISFMFEDCEALESINITGWDLSKLTINDVDGMFAGCRKLKEIIGLDTINNKNIQKFLCKSVKKHK